jgi:hypothetical protein
MSRATRIGTLVLLSFITISLATMGQAGSLKGKVRNGVYESPSKYYKVPIPKGSSVYDGVDGVTFSDDSGNLTMIAHTCSERTPSFTDSAAECKFLEAFLREFAMQEWFLPAAPWARIVRSVPGVFDGRRAVLAVLSHPQGSLLIPEGLPAVQMPAEARFGLVVFLRGPCALLLSTGNPAAVPDTTGAPPDSAWTGFVDKLEAFYRTVAFRK